MQVTRADDMLDGCTNRRCIMQSGVSPRVTCKASPLPLSCSPSRRDLDPSASIFFCGTTSMLCWTGIFAEGHEYNVRFHCFS